MTKSSLDYRKQRMSDLARDWNGNLVRPLFVNFIIPPHLLERLNKSVKLYISASLHFKYCEDNDEFMHRLEKQRQNRLNVTPNGAVVPKTENSLLYNEFLRSWCDVAKNLVRPNSEKLKMFRITPNIRIKYGFELEDNINRGLNTSHAHSDSWVEGPWGFNCHIPLLGDTKNNYLRFYKLKDELKFSDEFLTNSESYTDMHWVMDFYEEDTELVPTVGAVNLSDYALLHDTCRNQNCKTRISIDTTILVGNHEVHPDRLIEYVENIPSIGEDLFVKCNVSEDESIIDKPTQFSHYTTGKLTYINLLNN